MSGDVILITGASSDIGCELIRQLAQTDAIATDHATLIAHANSGAEKLEWIRKEYPVVAKRLEIMRADLGSEIELIEMIGKIRRLHGFPTHIVHLAAPKLELRRVTQFAWKGLIADLEVQIRSIGMILQAFLPDMARSGPCCKVVFMLSSATVGIPPKYLTQYTVGKYALLGFFRSVAGEYAGKPICFNAVSPSMVETQFLSNTPRKFVEMAAAAHPQGKNARVQDIVPVIRFLLSPDSDYISGANIPVTGGSMF